MPLIECVVHRVGRNPHSFQRHRRLPGVIRPARCHPRNPVAGNDRDGNRAFFAHRGLDALIRIRTSSDRREIQTAADLFLCVRRRAGVVEKQASDQDKSHHDQLGTKKRSEKHHETPSGTTICLAGKTSQRRTSGSSTGSVHHQFFAETQTGIREVQPCGLSPS
uniref:Uncharacterized protein n=1 Tax=Rhodococcus erythropolis TaxID=1833 RepID=A0A2Z5TTD4_RHOER|nr:hypothetical protein [Rhodococcus erythropolis]